ncbi:MAG TPA: NlpC/P60 family protein, partial [Acidimicrobiales bacterium]|nr:NlpC/P60 family protein [Acidimicrobiales bacterium]
IATAVAGAIVMVGAAVPMVARADQVANDQAQANNLSAYANYLAAKIASLGEREAALGEQYDAGVVALTAANRRVTGAYGDLAAARASQASTIGLLRQDAIEAYVGGGPQMALAGNLPVNDPNASLLRQELAQSFASEQADALDNYRLAADNAALAEQRLEAARNADAHQLALLQRARDQVQAAQDQLVATEDQVKGRVAALVEQVQATKLAQERAAEEALLKAQQELQAAHAAQLAREEAARRAAEAAAARRAELAQEATTTTTPGPPTTSQSTGYDPTQLPGVSPAASVAVAAAESRVGDPYVWGAAGPDAFDCSGLIMWAYAQAGVYLPHYSGAQFSDTTQVPMSDLEPGDLVFPADPGEHVAMYVGDGEIVEAPYSGADVHIVPMSSFFVLASRVG